MLAPYQLAVLCLLGLYFDTGEAVKCFACSSIHDHRCGRHFSNSRASAQQCMQGCVKNSGTRSTQLGDVQDISRGCATQTTGGCRYIQHNGIEVYSCTCSTDYCNGSVRMSVSTSAVVTSILMLISIFLWH